MNYVLHLLIVMSIYATLAVSLNVLAGYLGVLSLGHAAFYGIGAYVSTLLVVNAGFDFLSSMITAAAFCSVCSLVIGIPSLRLKADAFLLATLGFQMVVFNLLYSWTAVTGGPRGISGVPVPKLFGSQVEPLFEYFVMSLVFCVICLAVIFLLLRSPFGRLLKVIRDDQLTAATLGKNVSAAKIAAFAISGTIAAVPGALFAGYFRYVNPTSFSLAESIFILSIVIIGGAGRFWGPIMGAVLLVMLPELLRWLNIPSSDAANIRQIIYGLLLILLMRWRPEGLWGSHVFR